MKRYKVFSVKEYLLLFVFFILSVNFLYLHLQDLSYKGYKILKRQLKVQIEALDLAEAAKEAELAKVISYKALKKRQIETAQQYFNSGIEKNPSNVLNYLNLALSYDLFKQPKKAEKIYEIASSDAFITNNLNVFYLYFNRAELAGRLYIKPDQALKFYQKALGFHYKKEVVKKNIELLFKKKSQPPRSDSKSQNSQDSSQTESAPLENNSEGRESQEEQKGDRELKEEADQPSGAEESSEAQKQERGQSEEELKEGGESIEEGESEEDLPEDSPEDSPEDLPEDSPEDLPESLSKTQSSYGDWEKAVLEEIQKQENKVRSQLYKEKGTFGDKTDKNW